MLMTFRVVVVKGIYKELSAFESVSGNRSCVDFYLLINILVSPVGYYTPYLALTLAISQG